MKVGMLAGAIAPNFAELVTCFVHLTDRDYGYVRVCLRCGCEIRSTSALSVPSETVRMQGPLQPATDVDL
jgi:hypothetical protein